MLLFNKINVSKNNYRCKLPQLVHFHFLIPITGVAQSCCLFVSTWTRCRTHAVLFLKMNKKFSDSKEFLGTMGQFFCDSLYCCQDPCHVYRTRAIITRGLYLFYLIFHCGLYSREVYIAERLVLQGNFSGPWFLKNSSNVAKKNRIGK